ncbi:TetR/AcrR family transcriptional regulator [Devosia ginsengisoli]|uniref:TetR/AcrR family transcriptional regulator n=1 Tax=Devosia ginsengisoli TaxID=400770 RepID=UPI0026ED1606|nr:TetR/AcrR family transcriptional regulator [Devosia ginsengisoli]MCR6670464.1 TetR/AcrR family transcriptional regulator [Devosia ginsengisoli]
MTMDISLTGKRESGDDRRLAIAQAARRIIVEKGLEGLRTRDIAARVGINIATLHYHVPSKEALVALVAESLRHDFKAQALRHPRSGKNGLEQLRLEFDDFRETVVEMPDLIIILTELVERARRDAVIAEIMLPMRDFWRNQFADIFRLGISDCSFRPDLDPEAAALISTGALSDCWRQPKLSLSLLDRVAAELERAFTR